MKLTLPRFICIISFLVLWSCGNKTDREAITANEVPENESPISLYAHVDSVFKINNEDFAVSVRQYDNTEAAIAAGDTLSRPTYAVAISILKDDKVIFKDSVLRDSWGYEGKIVSIDAYELTFPQMSFENGQIQFLFRVYEQTDGDSIDGLIKVEVPSGTAGYEWRESVVQSE